MAEAPPPKRVRRGDSSAMWDQNESRDRPSKSYADDPKDRVESRYNRDSDRKPDDRRNGDRRDDRRHRSRSRDRVDRRRDRSRSNERNGRSGLRDHRQDRNKEDHGRTRNRSSSRDRYRSRRDQPSMKSDRHRDHSRSRSPVRNGHTSTRDRSPLRDIRSDRHKDKPRDAAIKPDTNGRSAKPNGKPDSKDMDIDSSDSEDEDEAEMAQMRKIMGFTSFKTTQNKKVPGNEWYGVRKEKKTEYRQYMNRVGGFNRPLSPGH